MRHCVSWVEVQLSLGVCRGLVPGPPWVLTSEDALKSLTLNGAAHLALCICSIQVNGYAGPTACILEKSPRISGPTQLKCAVQGTNVFIYQGAIRALC